MTQLLTTLIKLSFQATILILGFAFTILGAILQAAFSSDGSGRRHTNRTYFDGATGELTSVKTPTSYRL